MSSLLEQIDAKYAFLMEFASKKQCDEEGKASAEDLRWLLQNYEKYNATLEELRELFNSLKNFNTCDFQRCSSSDILTKKTLHPLNNEEEPKRPMVAIRSILLPVQTEEEEEPDLSEEEDPSFQPEKVQGKKRRLLHCSQCGLTDHNVRTCGKRRRMQD